MDTKTKIIWHIWVVLALAAFVGAFFTEPLWVAIIGWLFGSMNGGIMLSLVEALIESRKEYKKQKAESDGMSM